MNALILLDSDDTSRKIYKLIETIGKKLRKKLPKKACFFKWKKSIDKNTFQIPKGV